MGEERIGILCMMIVGTEVVEVEDMEGEELGGLRTGTFSSSRLMRIQTDGRVE